MPVVTERNPKGAGRKSSKSAVEERRGLILAALREGRYYGIHEDLAERFGVSRQQISEDIKNTFAELKEQRLSDAEDVKAHLKLRINDVERKARWGWDHSVGKIVREMVEQIAHQVKQAVDNKVAVPTRFEINLKSAPDKGFLDTILRCIQKEAELEGVALDKQQGTVVNVGMDWDQLGRTLRDEKDVVVIDDEVQQRLQRQVLALPPKRVEIGGIDNQGENDE